MKAIFSSIQHCSLGVVTADEIVAIVLSFAAFACLRCNGKQSTLTPTEWH
ncbi:MAG: hypothetical protein ACFBSC_17650 [Microcoleaceae cyanobacterium]